MFELPELIVLASQLNSVVKGRIVRSGSLGNSPHKFVWYNTKPDEFNDRATGKRVGDARAKGRWLFIALEPGEVLTLGEFGGRLLYHAPGSPPPAKYHLRLDFDDCSFLTAMTQMWGAMELYGRGAELEREYIRGMKPTPVDSLFTFDYFRALVDDPDAPRSRSVKALLTQDQTISGLGNAIAQDIMFNAKVNPRLPVRQLDDSGRLNLYDAIRNTVDACATGGGRNDEHDLFNKPGGYRRLMDASAAGCPCPRCGTAISRISYLGGACYFCPACQPDPRA